MDQEITIFFAKTLVLKIPNAKYNMIRNSNSVKLNMKSMSSLSFHQQYEY